MIGVALGMAGFAGQFEFDAISVALAIWVSL